MLSWKKAQQSCSQQHLIPFSRRLATLAALKAWLEAWLRSVEVKMSREPYVCEPNGEDIVISRA